MEKLAASIQSYTWGSQTALPELCGEAAPSKTPVAEYWYGAHPSNPSLLESGIRLDTAISTEPTRLLGSENVSRFGEQLPYLVKLLAADRPLSLQAHPSLEQAISGFSQENTAGVPINAKHRNYRDENHKPELVVALKPFEALAGFRPAAVTVELLDDLAVPGLKSYRDLLASLPESDGLRAVFTAMVTMSDELLATLVPEVAQYCRAYLAKNGAGQRWSKVAATVVQLEQLHPGDSGVLAVLLLNRLSLAPGEAIYLGAGNLHSYLSGLGVEIMANSDNVLRGGLTDKHVDVAELLRVLKYEPLENPVVRPEPANGAGFAIYPTPAREFRLSRLRPGANPTRFDGRGPRIIVCTSGEAVCASDSGHRFRLKPGEGAWLSAKDGPVLINASSDRTELFMSDTNQF